MFTVACMPIHVNSLFYIYFFTPQISIELINLGETSVTLREVLTNTLDGKEIATFYGKMVYINKLAKKSQVLPYWHRMKYCSVETPHRVRIDQTQSQVPEDAFRVSHFCC